MKRLLFFLAASLLQGQTYDLLIKNGHVIDPANRIDAVMDVAITGARIARVAAGIPAAQGRKVIDASGLYVTPGLIDLHAHVFGSEESVFPDDTALIAGTTTVVDAGGSGWRTFDEFRKTIIDRSSTRVLAFINIVGHGMTDPQFERRSHRYGAGQNGRENCSKPGRDCGNQNRALRRPGWAAIRQRRRGGPAIDTPVMVDDHIFTNSGRTTREKLLDHAPARRHAHSHFQRPPVRADRPLHRQGAALYVGGSQARRAVRYGPRRRQFPLACGEQGHGAGLSAG